MPTTGINYIVFFNAHVIHNQFNSHLKSFRNRTHRFTNGQIDLFPIPSTYAQQISLPPLPFPPILSPSFSLQLTKRGKKIHSYSFSKDPVFLSRSFPTHHKRHTTPPNKIAPPLFFSLLFISIFFLQKRCFSPRAPSRSQIIQTPRTCCVFPTHTNSPIPHRPHSPGNFYTTRRSGAKCQPPYERKGSTPQTRPRAPRSTGTLQSGHSNGHRAHRAAP